MGVTAYFAADSLSLNLLGKRAAILFDTLVQAETIARKTSGSPTATEDYISGTGLDFLVGKQVPPQLARLADGMHTLADGRFALLKRVDSIPYVLSGPLHSRKSILDNIGTMFLICSAAGFVVAIICAYLLAKRLSGPLQALAKNFKTAVPESESRIPPKFIERNDEIGELASALKRYQERTIAAIESEKSFVNAASHELRTPLTVISSGLELLESHMPSSGPEREIISRISRAADNMGLTVSALLGIARAEKRPLVKIDLKNIIWQVVAGFIPEDTAYDKTAPDNVPEKIPVRPGINLRIYGDLPGASGLPHLAAIVLRNLLDNAFRHSNGQDVQLTFTDNAFEIVNKAKFMPEDDNGLGLKICQRACERMRWRLCRVDKEDETIFRILMPGDYGNPENRKE